MKFTLLLLIFFHCSTFYCFSQQGERYNYGLRFKSHFFNLDDRTGLDLTAYSSFKNLDEGFAVSFDIKFLREEQTFGYVFRMISEGQSSFDFLSNLKDSEFSFVINKGLNHIISSKKVIAKDIFVSDQWSKVRVVFFKDKTKININDKVVILNNGIGSFKEVKLYFGANKHKYFHTTDVPPIIIKNIEIEESGKVIRKWTLDRHNEREVYDEIGGNRAKVDNGLWEINYHLNWTKELSLTVESAPQLAYDSKFGKVFVVGNDKIFRYNTVNKVLDTIQVKAGNPYRGVSRQIIYDTRIGELLSYTIQSSEVSRFSFVTNSWSRLPTIYADSRQHHNHIIDTSSNQLIILNGYGYHQYSGDIMSLDLAKDTSWQTINYDPVIYPRYLSALGVLDSAHVLLFGGYGSKSGKQEEFPVNYYDLYKINYKTGKNTKLWEISLDTTLVFSNSMYIDVKSQNFYVLGYSNLLNKSNISLYRFNIEGGKPVFTEFESKIPFNFLDIESFSDLFYDEVTNKLFAMLSYKNDNNQYEIAIYSIGYPVFNKEEIRQSVHTSTGRYLLLAVFAMILIIGGYFLRKRGFNLITERGSKDDTSASINQNLEAKEEEVIIPKDCVQVKLFAGVEIINRKGIDCTAGFTPILKNIFLCILLHTIRNKEKGISSYDLNQAFWQGMSSDKALNNRSVNMRKLRVLLASIGDIQIDHINSHWILAFNEQMECDYEIVLGLLQDMDNDGEFSYARISKIINLANGKFLPGIEGEWLDIFKTEFNSLLIKVLNNCLSSEAFNDDSSIKVQIADVMLLHDSLEENAIIYKCNLLYHMGQRGPSKRAFDKYCLEYEQVLDAKPKLIYQEVINREL